MYNTAMYALGANRSAIRSLYDYGQEQAVKIGKENVYDFSIGNPSIPAPACVQQEMARLAREESPAAMHGYTPAPGDPIVRQSLAAYMNQTFDANVRADNFYITCGASASLAIIMKALVAQEEDEIIVNAPFFPEYRVFAESAGGKLVVVPADTKTFQLSLDGLEQAITSHTKAVIINSPNNPSGIVYSADTMQAVGELLRRKEQESGHPIFLISDEPYREVIFDELPILYMPKFYDNTIVCYSYSKSLSLPGERVGYILIPDAVSQSRDLFTAVCGAGRALGFVCAPNVFQRIVMACQGQTADMGVYDANRKLIYEGLTRIGFECVYPSGAFYLFVKAPNGDAYDFMEKAKALNILIVPGDEFGCPGYCRISYCVDGAMIARSLKAFKVLYGQYETGEEKE